MKIKIKRAVAFYIDWLIILTIVIGITLLLCLFVSREFIEVFLKYFFPWTVPFVFLFKDSFGGRSIGKVIMHLKIVPLDGEKKSFWFYILRNLANLIPITPIYTLITSKSMGDVIMKTAVIEK